MATYNGVLCIYVDPYIFPNTSISFSKRLGISTGFSVTTRSAVIENPPPLYGNITINQPVYFASQNIGTGYYLYTGMEIWEKCVITLIKHN